VKGIVLKVKFCKVVEPMVRKLVEYKFVAVADGEKRACSVEEPRARKFVV